jgi:PAT family beta-lactamase induction signal transducer AmpG
MLNTNRNSWFWVPSLYFAQAIPNVVVVTVAVIFYKNLGLANKDIALYTSWLYLPWMLKPFWSPLVELFKTKRLWIVGMQFAIGAGLAGVALTIPTSNFLQYTLACFWLLAFSSATHDIAADGFYLIGQTPNQQAFFVGIRSTFYRLAMVAGQGVVVVIAGHLAESTGNVQSAWAMTFSAIAILFTGFAIYHQFILPVPKNDRPLKVDSIQDFFLNYLKTFALFFKKSNIGVTLAFILTYRLGEAQLVKMLSPFLLDPVSEGGLGLTTEQVGIAYGTCGILALTIGGICGGIVVSKDGLKPWLWGMVCAINLPNFLYVFLAYFKPDSLAVVNLAIAIEQFGYGFGFTAYMMYLIDVAKGEYQTVHYAIGTGLMAAGMMFPGMASGAIQEKLGYQHFFLWVMLCTIPGFIVTRLIDVESDFGKKGD